MKLIRRARGKETVVSEGSQSELRRRMVALRQSTRGGVSGRGGKKYPVEYRIEDYHPKTQKGKEMNKEQEKEVMERVELMADHAYPLQESLHGVSIKTRGLSKREYFAAIALQGFLSGPLAESDCGVEGLAHDAVMAADKLIAELRKDSK